MTEALNTYLTGSGGRVGTRSLLKLLGKLDPDALPQALDARQLRSSMDGLALERSKQLRTLRERVEATQTAMRSADASGVDSRAPTHHRRVFEIGSLMALRVELQDVSAPLNLEQSRLQQQLLKTTDRMIDERQQALSPSLDLQCATLAKETAAGHLSREAADAAIEELCQAIGNLVGALDANPALQGHAQRFLAGLASNRLTLNLRHLIADSGDQHYAGPLLSALDRLRGQYLRPSEPDPAVMTFARQLAPSAHAEVGALLERCDQAIHAGVAHSGALLLGAQRAAEQISLDHLPADINPSTDDRLSIIHAAVDGGLQHITPEAAARLSIAVGESALPLLAQIESHARNLLTSLENANRQAGLGTYPTQILRDCMEAAGRLEPSLCILKSQLRARALGLADSSLALEAEQVPNRQASGPLVIAELDTDYPELALAMLGARAGPAYHPKFETASLDPARRADALHCRTVAELLETSDLATPARARLARLLPEPPFAGAPARGIEATIRLAVQREAEIADHEREVGAAHLSPAALHALLAAPALAANAETLANKTESVLRAARRLGDPSLFGVAEMRTALALLREIEPLALSLEIARSTRAQQVGDAPDTQLDALEGEIRSLDNALGELLIAAQVRLPDLLVVQDPESGPEAKAAEEQRQAILDWLRPGRLATDPDNESPPMTESLQADLLQRAALYFKAAGRDEGVTQVEQALAMIDLEIRTDLISSEAIASERKKRGTFRSELPPIELINQEGSAHRSKASRFSDPRVIGVEPIGGSEIGSGVRPSSLSDALLSDLRAVGLLDEDAALRALSSRAEQLAEGDPDEVAQYVEDKSATIAAQLQAMGLAARADDLDLRTIGRLLADFAETLEDIYAGRPLEFNQYLSVAVMLR